MNAALKMIFKITRRVDTMENGVIGVSECGVRVVVCNKQVGNIPSTCSFCNLAFECKKAIKVDCKDIAKTVMRTHRKLGQNVSISDCKCIEKETEAREVPQTYIERKDVIYPGGTYEDNHLWEQRKSDFAC